MGPGVSNLALTDEKLIGQTFFSGKVVPVVQAFCYSKYLGYFELNFDTNGELKTPVDGVGVTNARPVLLDSTIAEEPKVQVLFLTASFKYDFHVAVVG